MRRFVLPATAVVVLLVSSATGLADDRREAARKDLDRLQGTWVMVSMETEGHDAEPEDFEGRNSVYSGDAVTLRLHDQVRRRGIVTLDPSRTPKSINTWDQDGPYQDQTVPGIYELEGDTLKLCFSRPGEERPTAFTTKAGTGFLYVVYKRMKP